MTSNMGICSFGPVLIYLNSITGSGGCSVSRQIPAAGIFSNTLFDVFFEIVHASIYCFTK